MRQLIGVNFEELVDSILGFTGRMPIGLLSEVILVVLW